MTKPNLYIVGFQKCGSTSLFEMLNQHHQIIGCQPKETFALVDKNSQRFHEKNNVNSLHFSWEKYYDFNKRDYKYLMEASVCNFNQKTALNYISNIDNRKVIFITRDPISRFRSSFDYFSYQLDYNIENINEFIKILKNPNEKNKLSSDGVKFALEDGRYVNYINKWINKLDEKSVHIIKFENLLKNTKTEMLKLEEFLEIDSFLSYQLPNKNESKPINNRKLHFFLKKKLSKLKLGRFTLFQSIYAKINRGGEKSIITPEDKNWLKNYYYKEYKIFYNKKNEL